jgi:hypothetical protein
MQQIIPGRFEKYGSKGHCSKISYHTHSQAKQSYSLMLQTLQINSPVQMNEASVEC